MVALLLGTAISFALLGLTFWPLEKAYPARRGQAIRRPELAVDLAFFLGQYLVWGSVAVAVLVAARDAIGAWIPDGFLRAVAGQPFWLRALEAILAGDLLVYWGHRAFHSVPLLWRFHAVHHSSEHLDWVAAHREHPVDGVLTQLMVNLPAFVLGFPIETIGAFIAFRGAWATFVHSNVRLPLGPLRVLLGAPELHHWHHARVEDTRHNFANLAPWVDVLFGTYHCPTGEERYALGLAQPFPRGYLRQLLFPFRFALRTRSDSDERRLSASDENVGAHSENASTVSTNSTG